MELKLVRTDADKEIVIKYIGSNYKRTPYLYVNAIKYGTGTDNCHTWIDMEKDRIRGIFLQYFDCLHFYSNEPDLYPIHDFMEFKENHSTKVLMTISEFGEKVEDLLNCNYYVEKNNVIDMDGIKPQGIEFKSSLAEKADVEKIVDLLLTDKEYTEVYTKDILLKQMIERFDDGFSRFFVVKMDNKVVASCSTYGEVPGFALIGSVIVHSDYRRRGLASDVENYACYLLENNNISRVGFVNYNNVASLALHEKLGAKKVSTLYKYVKK